MNSLKQFLFAFVRTFCISFFLVSVVFLLFLSWFVPVVAQRVMQIENSFSREAGRSAWTIGAELLAGYRLPPFSHTQRWLILGTDEVAGSNRTDILTDTILLASYDPSANAVRLLSFPRDIYLPDAGHRMNALYQTNLLSGNGRAPELGVQDEVSRIIGQPITSTLVVSLDELAEVIDIIGGLPIEVQNGFTDPQFPRSGVDVTVERDPNVLYETVRFEAGFQVMDGETALKFIRSRKALEPAEAGDEARARRQRQVIEALVQRLQAPEILGNPVVLGRLYDWYSRFVLANVPLTTLGRLGKTALQQQSGFTLESVDLPVTEFPRATDSATLFVHPPESKYNGAWVYEPVDPSWEQLQQFIVEKGL